MQLKRFRSNAISSAACEAAAAKFPPSVPARDRTVVRRLALREIEHDFVDVAPAPALRRVVALDDGMAGGMKMFRGVPVRRIVAAADGGAAPGHAQMQA